jgi:Holliday junction resolvasome RuvABC endonuclease subunit
MTIVLGLDLALIRTGAAIVGDHVNDYVRSFVVPSPPWTRARPRMALGERYTWFRDEIYQSCRDVMDMARPGEEVIVVVEDLVESFQIRKLGPVRGIAEQVIWEVCRVDPRLVSNMSVKVLATGDGNADKMDMVFAAKVTLGIGVANDDEADALWIADFGARANGMQRPDLPSSHLRALDTLG